MSSWALTLAHPPSSLPRLLGDDTFPLERCRALQQLCPEGHRIQVLAAGEPPFSQLLPWGTFSTQERNARIEFLRTRTWPQLPKTDSQAPTYHTAGYALYPKNTLPLFLLSLKKIQLWVLLWGAFSQEKKHSYSFLPGSHTKGFCQHYKEDQIQKSDWNILWNCFFSRGRDGGYGG